MKHFCYVNVFALAAILCASVSFAATHSFDQTNGVLAVDYAAYLSKHNVVFNTPITSPASGLTIGNGRVGAMVWNTNGITMQVTGVDCSPQTIFSEGWLNLATSPRMDSGYTTFQQTLQLYDGLITTRYDTNRTVTIMGSPNSELLGIHVQDSRPNLKSITFQLNMWDPNSQVTSQGTWNSMMSDLPDMTTWRTVTSFANATAAGINRGQTDVNNFGYTLAAAVEGANYTTQAVDTRTVKITITPTSSYTIWIACASRLNAPSHNSVTQAGNLLTAITTAGYAATLAAYTNWWHAFWAKSFVQYMGSDDAGGYLENMYYLANYVIAAGAYGNYPFHFINGVYRSNADISVVWSGGYWYWDDRNVYHSMLASNHVDVIDGEDRLYSRNLAATTTYTKTRFNIDGNWTPETMGFDGNARWTTSSTYTDNIYSTGQEEAMYMYLRFKYTNDSTFLKDTAYPYMRGAAMFYAAKLSLDPTLHQYYMASSNDHETYWNVKNAITDLSAVRALFPAAIQVAKTLNVDPDLQVRWKNVLDSLVPYKTQVTNGVTVYTLYDPPTITSMNVENVGCEMIWPYSLTGIGKPDYQTALNTFNNRPFQYGASIMPDAAQAARLGLGDNAYNGIKTYLKSQSTPNGLGGFFDWMGLHAVYINESILQSYDDTIRVFAALPSDAGFVSKFTLLAKGGFLVSSEKESGEIKYVGIKSLYGNPAAVINPWGTQQVQVRKTSDNSVILTTSNAVFSFTTVAAGVYVVERTAKNLSSYTFAQLTGTGNYSVKTFGGKSLGAGQGKAPPVSAKPSPLSTIAPVVSRTMRVAGDRFEIGKFGVKNQYVLTVYSLSGKRIRDVIVNKDIVDMRKDVGVSSGVYIVRVRPVAGEK
jgi:hypothetical protein